ncbi:Pyrimidine 5'-nucleotidase YjjG [compost metagenome]
MVVGIITNGNEEHQRSKLRTLGLSRYVPEERTIISSSVGFTKPDPRIFQLANVRTGTKAHNSLYIGDSWSKDIVGACEAGWHAVWFNPLQAAPGEGNKPAAVVSTYAELRELLGV